MMVEGREDSWRLNETMKSKLLDGNRDAMIEHSSGLSGGEGCSNEADEVYIRSSFNGICTSQHSFVQFPFLASITSRLNLFPSQPGFQLRKGLSSVRYLVLGRVSLGCHVPQSMLDQNAGEGIKSESSSRT